MKTHFSRRAIRSVSGVGVARRSALLIIYVCAACSLLRRAKNANNPSSKSAGPAVSEFYLLDPATGQTQLVKGIFAPLEEEGRRSLQPTGKPNEYWAAIPEYEKGQTRIGRYKAKDFSFQPLLVVPHLVFDSREMWVDEPAAKLYVVYNSQLLRLPFRSKP